jgi:TatA/E family protein of Tat protein translocase
MLGSIGFQEIAVILGIALLIFGPRKLPEIGKTLGRSLGEFRRATSDLKRSIEEEVKNIPEEDDETGSKTGS